MRFAIVTHRAGKTNTSLAARCLAGFEQVRLLSPREALALLRPGDVALGRLDVRETLDGIESGLPALSALAARGITVFNPPGALISAHDKLLTARALERADVSHPRTEALGPGCLRPTLGTPLVVKPRFGSWARDVVLCRDRQALTRRLAELEARPWFWTHGAVAQELVPPVGHDLRIIVAAGQVVGAIKRVAARGEWRTNLALGGRRQAVVPSPAACELARAAAASIGADLVGIDLLPMGPGRYTVIELNGAVDFGPEYSLGAADVFDAVLHALAGAAHGEPALEPPALAHSEASALS
jgi:RimK family alpha-L-glutamate ligase